MAHMSIAGPAAFPLFNAIVEFAASSGIVPKRIFLENAMCNLSTTLCRGITRPLEVPPQCRCVPGGSCLPLHPYLWRVVTLCACRY